MELEIVTMLLALAGAVLGGLAFFRKPRTPVDIPAEETMTKTPGSCAKVTDHKWAKRAHLTSGDEHVHWCLNGCGSSLRHKTIGG